MRSTALYTAFSIYYRGYFELSRLRNAKLSRGALQGLFFHVAPSPGIEASKKCFIGLISNFREPIVRNVAVSFTVAARQLLLYAV